MAGRKKSYVVPGCRAALDEWKYEIAEELGLFKDSDHTVEFAAEFDTIGEQLIVSPGGKKTWADVSAREAGSVGGRITARLIAAAQQSIVV